MGDQLLAWVSSAILMIGAVWGVFLKYGPKVRKAIKVTDDILEILDELIAATDDRTITKEEIEAISIHISNLRATLKGAK